MRRSIGLVVGASFGIMLVATCGKAGDHVMASNDGGSDSAGVMTMTLKCDQTFERTVPGPPMDVTTTYFAELTLPGASSTSAAGLSVVGCDYESFGASQSPFQAAGCSGQPGCTTTGYVPPSDGTECSALPYTITPAGKLVVLCGSHDVQTPLSGAATESGRRAKTVYVRSF